MRSVIGVAETFDDVRAILDRSPGIALYLMPKVAVNIRIGNDRVPILLLRNLPPVHFGSGDFRFVSRVLFFGTFL